MYKKLSKQKALMASSLILDLCSVLDMPDLSHEIYEVIDQNLEYEDQVKFSKAHNSIVDCGECEKGSNDYNDFHISKAKLSISAIKKASDLDKHLFAYALMESLLDFYPTEYVEEVMSECLANRPS